MPAHNRKSLEQVINEFTYTHGNRYDYTNVSYKGSKVKVEIICLEHGSFLQYPNDHKNGSGCSKCSKNKKITQDEFITRSQTVHGQRYDLSSAKYISSKVKVEIICMKHGPFFISPSDFWCGVGCRECGYEKQLETKINNGTIVSPDKKDDFLAYRENVRKLSDRNYIDHYYDINPSNLPRGDEYHLDHIISILDGFLLNLSEEEIAHPSNLQIISALENKRKGSRSDSNMTHINQDKITTVKRKRRSINRYEIIDLLENNKVIVDSITDWCDKNKLSVSSVRWAASYQTTPFKNRYLIKKLLD